MSSMSKSIYHVYILCLLCYTHVYIVCILCCIHVYYTIYMVIAHLSLLSAGCRGGLTSTCSSTLVFSGVRDNTCVPYSIEDTDYPTSGSYYVDHPTITVYTTKNCTGTALGSFNLDDESECKAYDYETLREELWYMRPSYYQLSITNKVVGECTNQYVYYLFFNVIYCR